MPKIAKSAVENAEPFASILAHDETAAELTFRTATSAAYADLRTAAIGWSTALNEQSLSANTSAYALTSSDQDAFITLSRMDKKDCIGCDLVVYYKAVSSVDTAMATYPAALDASNATIASAIAGLLGAYATYVASVRAAQITRINAVHALERYWTSYEAQQAELSAN